jgi:hypothetical protein
MKPLRLDLLGFGDRRAGGPSGNFPIHWLFSGQRAGEGIARLLAAFERSDQQLAGWRRFNDKAARLAEAYARLQGRVLR